MIIIEKIEQKYFPGLEDGKVLDKPFIYSMIGNLVIHPDDIIGITDDGSKYIVDADEVVIKFRHNLYKFTKSILEY